MPTSTDGTVLAHCMALGPTNHGQEFVQWVVTLCNVRTWPTLTCDKPQTGKSGYPGVTTSGRVNRTNPFPQVTPDQGLASRS